MANRSENLDVSQTVELFVDYPTWLLQLAASCCVLFMLIGIPGNLITIVALYRTKKLRNATSIFIMNLSVSDLMFCCFNLPLATSTFWHSSWLHGPLLCKFFPLLRYGLVAVSLFSIFGITINRYIMIGHPSLYPKLYKFKYLIPMVLATWILAFGSLIPTWLEQWGRFGLDTEIGSCSILSDLNGRNPKVFLFLVAFLIPCIAIVISYARIFYIVRRTASKCRGRSRVSSIDLIEGSIDRKLSEKKNEDELSVLGSSFLSRASKQTTKTKLRDEESSEKQILPDRKLINREKEEIIIDLAVRNERENEMEDNGLKIEPIITNIDDIPFADESEDVVKFNGPVDPPSKKRGILKKLASRASFQIENSPWRQKNLSEMKERTSRRESKFRNIDRFRNINELTGRLSAKDKKLLKMILVIFLSFLLCYSPITVTKIFKHTGELPGLNIAGYLLIYFTTCINPVIYVIMSSEYRSAYRNVLLCRTYLNSKHRR